MPGLISFLSTPQPTRTNSSFTPARPVNSYLGTDQGVARGSNCQTPIQLDNEPEPVSASASRNATHTQQHQQHQHQHIDSLVAATAPDSTQTQQALPSFLHFAATLDYQPFDATALQQNGAPQTPNRQPITDEYLSALVDGNFSSPSSYPRHIQDSADSFQHPNLAQSPRNPPHRHPSGTPLRPDRPARYSRQNTNAALRAAAAARNPTSHPASRDNELEDSLFVSSDDESRATMPVQTRRRASTIPSSDHDPDPEEIVVSATRKRAAPSSAPTRGTAAPKRRRTSQPQTVRDRTTTPGALTLDDDIFGEDAVDVKKGKGKVEEVIDLADTNEVPEDLKAPKDDNRVKISAFQCVICMDDVTALTVTHCGHLFCSECLHSALNVDATKNKCPICRQKVETKDRNTYTSKTKGFWPLELKLMTASRKGKQRA
ncbi:hypothetical protein CGRA01v4_06831 [Colletotrichum graminicola]|uniref:RING-type domain-containing protein n=1 Tax=Colletotrichum graminicola (strain M1.001 / M2 / FGSC 10212) TaxID=645133 RepID=E3Q2T3_COLGM|nr:uncharacterized protein GLRG_00056 [Colletotrichum graminicola M1.001]EFQ24912.1 hypothetical protein GLRG_00056 [Colletotrichum graminicola M1.001]WDK15550.1 hypothetical protein CGRA01v4_06831 [Colletotrichum graminicola]